MINLLVNKFADYDAIAGSSAVIIAFGANHDAPRFAFAHWIYVQQVTEFTGFRLSVATISVVAAAVVVAVAMNQGLQLR